MWTRPKYSITRCHNMRHSNMQYGKNQLLLFQGIQLDHFVRTCTANLKLNLSKQFNSLSILCICLFHQVFIYCTVLVQGKNGCDRNREGKKQKARMAGNMKREKVKWSCSPPCIVLFPQKILREG